MLKALDRRLAHLEAVTGPARPVMVLQSCTVGGDNYGDGETGYWCDMAGSKVYTDAERGALAVTHTLILVCYGGEECKLTN